MLNIIYILLLSFKLSQSFKIVRNYDLIEGYRFRLKAIKNDIWNGNGLTQSDLMHQDECILVDENDQIIGHASKYNSHRFTKNHPSGRLHRAFSVFLFNNENKLLLQKRAASKITFPNVWTNTCCSHPLYGYFPLEIDETHDIDQGIVNGIKNAAIRKLNHELGIDTSKLHKDDFKYLTRLHYSATNFDDQSRIDQLNDDEFCWGESEIDYILFIKSDLKIRDKDSLDDAMIDIVPNPDEIDELKYVTLSELKDMLNAGNKFEWSPWFGIICKHFLSQWWENLDTTFNTNTYCDYKTIHKLTT